MKIAEQILSFTEQAPKMRRTDDGKIRGLKDKISAANKELEQLEVRARGMANSIKIGVEMLDKARAAGKDSEVKRLETNLAKERSEKKRVTELMAALKRDKERYRTDIKKEKG